MECLLKISPEQLAQEFSEWFFLEPRTEIFGQYIYNRYGNKNTSFPELFYENNNRKAYEIALNNIVIISSKRIQENLSLNNYDRFEPNPLMIEKYEDLDLPDEEIYVLRMLLSIDCGQTMFIPQELNWVKPIIHSAIEHQRLIQSSNPFVYITIRHGIVRSVTDDLWHVDGFSLKIPHRPEQNYVWCSHSPTEWWDEKIKIPSDFDGMKHNLHLFFQDYIGDRTDKIKTLKAKAVYCLDPYVIHRRPPNMQKINRTFIRVSFTPIPIMDVNNSKNESFNIDSTRDGILEFRNNLTRYNGSVNDG